MKELQVFANSCGNEEIIGILTDESVLSEARRAYGNYIFSPTEVLTHRSVLSYRIKKILEKKGISRSGDPMDVNVTRILIQSANTSRHGQQVRTMDCGHHCRMQLLDRTRLYAVVETVPSNNPKEL